MLVISSSSLPVKVDTGRGSNSGEPARRRSVATESVMRDTSSGGEVREGRVWSPVNPSKDIPLMCGGKNDYHKAWEEFHIKYEINNHYHALLAPSSTILRESVAMHIRVQELCNEIDLLVKSWKDNLDEQRDIYEIS
ncbi:hypothetical protein HOY80DRAFT_1049152 [Tuber brumale]|nr:hypothetical protein HOY80DRAFT_1049152 [Tuber brumale]